MQTTLNFHEKTRADEIRERFLTFHDANPAVWFAFVEISKKAFNKGYSNWGASAAFEVIRWEKDIQTHGDSLFKLSNDFRALYARAFNLKYPEYGHFFKVRFLRSSEKVASGYGEFIDVRSAGDEQELTHALQTRIERIAE
jgi:hypothetical protein